METFARLGAVKKAVETMGDTCEETLLRQDVLNYYMCLQHGIIAPELQEITAMVESFEIRINEVLAKKE